MRSLRRLLAVTITLTAVGASFCALAQSSKAPAAPAAASAPSPTTASAPSPAASATGPSVSSAPPNPPPTSAGPKPLGITVSGGVSLGAYEAGLLYYIVETIKANPERMRLELLTGASAGSINSLLSLLASCSPEVRAPTASLLFKAWADVGFEQLFQPDDVRPTGLFSRRGLSPVVEQLRETWKAGLPVTCDAIVGVATTRTSPDRRSDVHLPMTLSRVEERFSLRVRGRGVGQPLQVESYVDRSSRAAQSMLPSDASGAVAFDDVRDLLFASSAFPLAFPSQKVRHCYSTDLSKTDGRCTGESVRTDSFIDGGVFDNQPIRLAARLAASGLVYTGARWAWRDVPDLKETTLPPDLRLFHVAPDLTDYPQSDLSVAAAAETGAVDVIANFVASFVDTARSKELASLFEERPDIVGQVTVSRSQLPTTSGLLNAFFGFFERDFRVFDFTLGMVDGRRLLEEELLPRTLGVELAKLVVFPDPVKKGVDVTSMAEDWQRYACIRGVMEGDDSLALACRGDSEKNFRALVQTAFDRLYASCEALKDRRVPTTSRRCLRAMEGDSPPRVPGITDGERRDWKKHPGETELEHTLRRLTGYHFAFHDLGVEEDKPDEAMLAIRHRLGRALTRFADVQPSGGRALLRVLGVPALNLLYYAPPDDIVYGVIGSPMEVGYSGALSRRFRWNPAMQIRGLGSLLASGDRYLAATPLVGLELNVPYLNGSLIQTRLGLRAGYILSSSGGFPFKPCTQTDLPDVGRCSHFTTQATLVGTVYDRLRAHITFEYLPKLGSDSQARWEISPLLGAQLTWN